MCWGLALFAAGTVGPFFPSWGASLVATRLDLGSSARAFVDASANILSMLVGARAQGMTSPSQLAALCNGLLGACEQEICHASIMADRWAVAIKQVNPSALSLSEAAPGSCGPETYREADFASGRNSILA
jgi:hypothetical protein